MFLHLYPRDFDKDVKNICCRKYIFNKRWWENLQYTQRNVVIFLSHLFTNRFPGGSEISTLSLKLKLVGERITDTFYGTYTPSKASINSNPGTQEIRTAINMWNFKKLKRASVQCQGQHVDRGKPREPQVYTKDYLQLRNAESKEVVHHSQHSGR